MILAEHNANITIGYGIWQVRCSRLSVSASRHVREGVHEVKGLLFGELMPRLFWPKALMTPIVDDFDSGMQRSDSIHSEMCLEGTWSTFEVI